MARSEGKKNEILSIVILKAIDKALQVTCTFNATRLSFVYTSEGIDLANGCEVKKLSDAVKLAQRANRLPSLPDDTMSAFDFIKYFADNAPEGKRQEYYNEAKSFVINGLGIKPSL